MNRVISWLRNLVYPRRCMLCRCFLAKEETDLCHRCRADAPVYPFGASNPPKTGKINTHFLDSFTAVWYYEGDVRKSILRYKFYWAVHLAPKFGRMLAMKLLQQGPAHFDMLTWVPVSRARRFKRGYDQCRLLARCVGKELGTPAGKVLRKKHNVPPQSTLLSIAQRKANVLGAYEVVGGADVRGKVIVLVDDILTTGATMNECARILLSAGAKEVHGAAIAATRKNKAK